MNAEQYATIWTAKEAAVATGGRVQGDWRAAGMSIDTRTLKSGDLFIALQGDMRDGHEFVKAALDKGAAAALVSRIPEGVPAGAPLLVVKDTFIALQDLGRAARARTGGKIIAVTGSVGKTGTKEMLAAAFGALGQVHASRASFNNHWGVPLSLSGMDAGADYGVFEIGMNHSGEITPLSQMVRPDIAIITTVAPVHLEHFSSVQQIAAAKAEIFDGMQEGSAAVLNRGNEWFSYLKAAAEARGLRVFGFGDEDSDADARLLECVEASNGTRIHAAIRGQETFFTLRIPGRHIALNALAVLLAVDLAGGNVKGAVTALEKIQPIAGRGLREYLDIGDPKNPVTLIDESYNASPVAMNAAFKVLALIDPGRGGRRIAVLGDMLELGKQGPKLHADLALPLQAADVQLVYTCGPLMKNLYDSLPQDRRGAHRKDSVELASIVPEVLTPGDVVMVKGSHGSKMGVVVEALRTLPEKLKRKKVENAL
jgi:UDP-N-acetylmuramoyl-tripeptide--D-alanyl-D-alanine ligase